MISPPPTAAALVTRSPPTTSDSLLARARRLPAARAARVDSRPANPTSAFPRPHGIGRPIRRAGQHHVVRGPLHRESIQRPGAATGGQCGDPEAIRVTGDDVQSRASDASRRPENGHTADVGHRNASRNTQAAGMDHSNESMRSRSPP